MVPRANERLLGGGEDLGRVGWMLRGVVGAAMGGGPQLVHVRCFLLATYCPIAKNFVSACSIRSHVSLQCQCTCAVHELGACIDRLVNMTFLVSAVAFINFGGWAVFVCQSVQWRLPQPSLHHGVGNGMGALACSPAP